MASDMMARVHPTSGFLTPRIATYGPMSAIPPMSSAAPPEAGQLLPNKLFVGGLSSKTNERDLREVIQKMAEVKEVKIITDSTVPSKSGEPRRYAFVELASDRDEDIPILVQKIVEHYHRNELELHGRRLNIGLAYKKSPSAKQTYPGVDLTGQVNLFQLQQQMAMLHMAAGYYPPQFTMPVSLPGSPTIPSMFHSPSPAPLGSPMYPSGNGTPVPHPASRQGQLAHQNSVNQMHMAQEQQQQSEQMIRSHMMNPVLNVGNYNQLAAAMSFQRQ